MINEKYNNILKLDEVLSRLSEYACSESAKEKALALKPDDAILKIQDEIDKADEALKMIISYGEPHFAKIKDPSAHLSLAKAGGILSAAALLNIAAVLRQARTLTEYYSQADKFTHLKPMFGLLEAEKGLERKIGDAIISEEEIADNASAELYAIRRKMRSLSDKIKTDLEKMIRSSTYKNALQDGIVTMRDGRYVLPVKADHKSEISGLVHDTSSSGATLFVEPMSVVEANNDIRVAQAEEKKEIERILQELSAMSAEKADIIESNFNSSIALDVYFAKAKLAADMNAVKPIIGNDGIIELNKARHPLIDKSKVVPIDIKLGGEYKSFVITGPNTGGKTVTLKTIGLLTLMSMCGMLIPAADNSRISVFKNILVDIGDEQSIAQSLSTFSAHMTNIISILDIADENSLVLIDELGSGTDPVEGAALAEAILEQLKEQKAVVAVTTHYAELKIYALETEGVINASCEFDVKTLRPTYRLLIGTPGRSNAFEISKRLGISDNILDRANRLVTGEKKRFENVIDSLERERQGFEESEKELNKARRELEQLKSELKNANADAIEKRDKIIEEAQKKAQNIVDKVKLDSAYLIEELDKLRKEKEKADFAERAAKAKSGVRSRLEQLSREANPVIGKSNEGYILPRKLKKGDEVLLVDINKQGYVIETPAENAANVLVQTGIIKTKTAISNLRLIEDKKKQPAKKTGGTRTIKSQPSTGTMELDLRGMTVEEAIMELDMFVSKSLLANISLVTIIHGKGTGALRAAVHSYLKTCRQVKTYRLGVYGEGEAGVTIAEFK